MSEFWIYTIGFVLLIVGGIARSRRRARMTPEERGLEDVAYEIRQLRRDQSRRIR